MCRSMHSGCGAHVGYRGDSNPRGSMMAGGAVSALTNHCFFACRTVWATSHMKFVETLHVCKLCMISCKTVESSPREHQQVLSCRPPDYTSLHRGGRVIENPLEKQVATRMGICEFKITSFPLLSNGFPLIPDAFQF